MPRRKHRLARFFLLSALLHAVLIALLFPVFVRRFRMGEQTKQPKLTVSILRLESRPSPKPSRAPRPNPTAAPVVRAPAAHHPAPDHVTAAAPVPAHHRVGPPHIARVKPSDLAKEQQAFAQTIAQAKAAQDPVTGAQSDVVPNPPKTLHFNTSSVATMPSSGEGYLTPLRRWVEASTVYYYVRYSVTYPDGTIETGIVPWPIHFPLDGDPFAHGVHSMPLPGPAPDYVAGADTVMHPLVKYCYDHRYDYCPIARKSGA